MSQPTSSCLSVKVQDFQRSCVVSGSPMHISSVPSASQRSLDISVQATELGCLALCLILSPFTSHWQKIISCGISLEQEWL